MNNTFRKIVELTLDQEGGYVNHPDDKGGETKYGITKRNYPHLEIADISEDDARRIYYQDYWQKFKVDTFPAQYQHIYFDMLVNNGAVGAAKVMQRAIVSSGGTLVIDGAFGPKSLNQLCVHKPSIFAVRYYRIKWYYDIVKRYPDQHVFLMGWIKRALEI